MVPTVWPWARLVNPMYEWIPGYTQDWIFYEHSSSIHPLQYGCNGWVKTNLSLGNPTLMSSSGAMDSTERDRERREERGERREERGERREERGERREERERERGERERERERRERERERDRERERCWMLPENSKWCSIEPVCQGVIRVSVCDLCNLSCSAERVAKSLFLVS